MAFDFDRYGPTCASLIAAAEKSTIPLGPGQPGEELRETLAGLDDPSMFPGRTVTDPRMAACCRSGLWILHNFLDESHTISQDIKTSSGSYWHGIMHRREPDYPNAKYWFRQTGEHAVFEEILKMTRQAAETADRRAVQEAAKWMASQMGDRWDPFLFVDLCEQAEGAESAEALACQIAAEAEWGALFNYCYERAVC